MSLERLEARDKADHARELLRRLCADVGEDPLQLVERAFGFGVEFATNNAQGRRTCRVCGCWEMRACDGACWWEEEDLCSACVLEETLP